MRSLHEIRRDWLSDEELWLAIPEGETQRHCLTHVPRHSSKLMVEFFLALNTNIGSWIQNLERRDMMLLGSLAENIFGFTGAYARKKQASLAPILTGWKRWMKFNSMSDDKMPRTGWLLNLRISGSISTNKVEKAVSWNVGSHGYIGSKKKEKKFCQKRTPASVSPLLDLHNHSPESKKRLQRPTICILGSDSTSLGVLSQSHANTLPSFQTNETRYSKGNRLPSLNHSGTDIYRDHIPAHEHLPIHSLESHGAIRHVDHDGELDHQTKKQPYYNAGGSELCTPWLPLGLRTTPQQGSRNGGQQT